MSPELGSGLDTSRSAAVNPAVAAEVDGMFDYYAAVREGDLIDASGALFTEAVAMAQLGRSGQACLMAETAVYFADLVNGMNEPRGPETLSFVGRLARVAILTKQENHEAIATAGEGG